MNPTKLIEMKLHEELTIQMNSGMVTILRVLTGWIYYYYFHEIDLQESVYVPETTIEPFLALEQAQA